MVGRVVTRNRLILSVRGSRDLWDEPMVGKTILQKYLFRDITGISIGCLFVCKTQE